MIYAGLFLVLLSVHIVWVLRSENVRLRTRLEKLAARDAESRAHRRRQLDRISKIVHELTPGYDDIDDD